MIKPASVRATVSQHRHLQHGYHSLTFEPFPAAARCRPGQFLHLRLPDSGLLFRRAFSVAAVNDRKHQVEIIVKVLGRGSRLLGGKDRGDTVDILGPLGRPFTLPKKTEETVMVAGGAGFPPLLFLAERMIARGHESRKIHFFYGGATADDLVERTRIRRLGVELVPVTEDGSLGAKGLVTGPVRQYLESHPNSPRRLYGCGPEAMLKATQELAMALAVPGQLSLEAPMPCGIGVCLGCVVPLTNGGHARVCCDGPVFDIGEVAL